jgi:hypothetical protein
MRYWPDSQASPRTRRQHSNARYAWCCWWRRSAPCWVASLAGCGSGLSPRRVKRRSRTHLLPEILVSGAERSRRNTLGWQRNHFTTRSKCSGNRRSLFYCWGVVARRFETAGVAKANFLQVYHARRICLFKLSHGDDRWTRTVVLRSSGARVNLERRLQRELRPERYAVLSNQRGAVNLGGVIGIDAREPAGDFATGEQ